MDRARCALLFSSACALGVTLVPELAEAACPGGLADWHHRAPVTFDNEGTAQPEHLALVTVDTAALVATGKLQASGGDLRFADQACNVLDAWVDSGLGTTATKIWVKLPAGVPAGTSSMFFYYGNPAATRVNDPAPLFGSGLVALYTFTEGAGTRLTDHVGGYDLTLTGDVTWTSGFRTGTSALTGFGPNSRVTRTSTKPSFGTGDFSVISIAMPTDVSMMHGVIGTYKSDGTSGWGVNLAGQARPFSLVTAQGDDRCTNTRSGITPNAWHFLGVHRSEGTHGLFIDNSLVRDTQVCPDDQRNVSAGETGPLQLGNAYESAQTGHFVGRIALTALYSTPRSNADFFALRNALGIGARITVTIGTEQGRPDAPLGLQVEAGRGSATFGFAPPANATTSTVTCNPGGHTVTTALVPPVTMDGLTNGTTYTCTVHATNELGDGPDSAAVEIIPGALPSAARNVMATVDGTNATLSFAPPLDDGGMALAYDASCQNGALTKESTASPIVLEDLALGTYTCTVSAKNAKGTGPASNTVSFAITKPGGGTPDGGSSADAGPTDAGPPSDSGATPDEEPSSDGGDPSSRDAGPDDGSGGGCQAADMSSYPSGGTAALLVVALAAALSRRRSRSA